MLDFLDGFGNVGSALGGLIALILLILGPIKWFLNRKTIPKVEVINQPLPPAQDDDIKMSPKAFADLNRRLRDEARAEIADATGEERKRLEEKIDALNARLADPDRALAEQQAIITSLEDQLTRRGNEIGGDELATAKAALEAGDFTAARALFETLAARTQPEVQANADAAFALGQIAEAEVRWHDAATHYATAARLTPTFDTLNKAHEFAWQSGDYPAALRFGEDLVAVARKDPDQTRLAAALNEHALTLDALGRLDEAEPLYRQALAICETTIGINHPEYATHLNNLACLLQAQDKLDEAEPLYRQALAINAATLGINHPGYASYLNNLAGLLRAHGKLDEAEPLYRQALEIGAATIGINHPNYAIRLNNLADLLCVRGKLEEAESLLRQALAIDAASIGTNHPLYATDLNNLAILLQQLGRFGEAKPFYAQALAIRRDRLTDTHPSTQKTAAHYLRLLVKHFPTDPEIPTLRALLAVTP